MSLVRFAVVAATFASLALASNAADAAEVITLPKGGSTSVGFDFAKSSTSGNFGASVELYATGSMRNYAELCASTAPAQMCQGETGFFQTLCKDIAANIHATECAKTGYGFDAEGGAVADLTLFGTDVTLFNMSAMASAEPEGASANYNVTIADAVVLSGSSAAQLDKDVTLADRTLFEASSEFFLGPIPLTVSASAIGQLGIDFNLTPGTSQVQGTVTPHAGIDGEFSAGVGCSFASAGVEGDLTLFNLSTPATATLSYAGSGNFNWNTSLDLDIDALDGSISLYAEAVGYKASKTLISWDGIQYSQNLGSKSGTVSSSSF